MDMKLKQSFYAEHLDKVEPLVVSEQRIYAALTFREISIDGKTFAPGLYIAYRLPLREGFFKTFLINDQEAVPSLIEFEEYQPCVFDILTAPEKEHNLQSNSNEIFLVPLQCTALLPARTYVVTQLSIVPLERYGVVGVYQIDSNISKTTTNLVTATLSIELAGFWEYNPRIQEYEKKKPLRNKLAWCSKAVESALDLAHDVATKPWYYSLRY